MIRIGSAIAATGLVFATIAFAQTTPAPGQDICAMGYEKADKDGMMGKISTETIKTADTNNDGKISKAEFDSACEKKIFKPEQKN